jgi:hypothetical protein
MSEIHGKRIEELMEKKEGSFWLVLFVFLYQKK